MTPFSSKKLAISLPGAEMVNLPVSGSVIQAEEVVCLDISEALRLAVRLVEDHCALLGVETVYLVRPEMFTHGVALAWLHRQIGEVDQHLCLSDASTIKLLAGCVTHVFFYNLAAPDSLVQLRKLERRSGEVLAQLHSQINTNLIFEIDDMPFQPAPIWLLPGGGDTAAEAAAEVYYFQHLHGHEYEANGGLLPVDPFTLRETQAAAHTVHIPLSEAALADTAFTHALASIICAATLARQPNVIFTLPVASARLEAAYLHLIRALERTELTLPRKITGNIFLQLGGLPGGATMAGGQVFCHESFDFWRHPRRFYEGLAQIKIASSGLRKGCGAFLPVDVAALFGPQASRVWLQPGLQLGDDA